jgi:hypothetical protein
VSRLPLTFASCRYDRLEAIRDGDVAVEGVELNCLTLKSGRDVFDRMVGGREFDVAELSASEYISLFGAGDCPFAAIPVFPSRVFRHGYIFVNTRAGIRTPKDLEGRRVGLPLYTQTAAIWARGHLQHQFGVDLATIRWVQGAVEKAGTHGSPHAPPLLAPVRIEQNHGGEPLGELLARGEIDALIGSRKPESFGRHPDVARLFPDYRARERDLYETTGIFPIMHHRIQAAGARAPALCGIARRHAAVAPGRDRGDRHGVRRRCLAVRAETQPGDPAGPGPIHGRAALHRAPHPDRGAVRPAAGRAGELKNAVPARLIALLQWVRA